MALPLASFYASPMLPHVYPGLQRLNIISCKTVHTSSIFLVSGRLRHSPQIFTVSLRKPIRAQHLSLCICCGNPDLERPSLPF